MADVPSDNPISGLRFWGFLAFMLALMALFLMLGTWQLERLGEKERLIANVVARSGEPSKLFPEVGEWKVFDAGGYDFRAVSLTGTYRPEDTVLVFTSLVDQKGQFSGPGYWVMTPLVLATGGTVFINRGFVPQASGAAFAQGGTVETGLVTIAGIARNAEQIGSFTPAPDQTRRVEWVRHPPRLAAMAGDLPEPVAPVYIDLPAGPPGTLPQGGETVIEFPNNHVGYAITWYGFALIVPFLLFFWVRRQQTAPAQPGT
ncbi:MAG: SURF1 family cytochrome oxidase biogenesis protein [Devosia sp.]|nr:SURF1 family cytochrome oxidase biogenesis protein [Devosia sp.]